MICRIFHYGYHIQHRHCYIWLQIQFCQPAGSLIQLGYHAVQHGWAPWSLTRTRPVPNVARSMLRAMRNWQLHQPGYGRFSQVGVCLSLLTRNPHWSNWVPVDSTPKAAYKMPSSSLTMQAWELAMVKRSRLITPRVSKQNVFSQKLAARNAATNG